MQADSAETRRERCKCSGGMCRIVSVCLSADSLGGLTTTAVWLTKCPNEPSHGYHSCPPKGKHLCCTLNCHLIVPSKSVDNMDGALRSENRLYRRGLCALQRHFNIEKISHSDAFKLTHAEVRIGAFGDCGRFDGPATALASDFRGRPLPFLPVPSGNGAEDEEACFDGKGGGLRGGT